MTRNRVADDKRLGYVVSQMIGYYRADKPLVRKVPAALP
jgi:hypothetical protein